MSVSKSWVNRKIWEQKCKLCLLQILLYIVLYKRNSESVIIPVDVLRYKFDTTYRWNLDIIQFNLNIYKFVFKLFLNTDLSYTNFILITYATYVIQNDLCQDITFLM